MNKNGDKQAFDKNWNTRQETRYIHWTSGEPKNQIQLAFRNHWLLFQEIMKSMNQCERVLEVGCGRGSMSAYFASDGFDCTLLDSSKEAIETAEKIFEQYGLKAAFDVGDALDLPYDKEAFDVVFSIGLLEHFKEVDVLLKEQIRVLRSGGLFLGYVVPQYFDNVQKEYNWINDILKGMVDEKSREKTMPKIEVFRSDLNSKYYSSILNMLPVRDVISSGVYPLPMISYSPEFPFTLLNPKSEQAVLNQFNKILDERKVRTGKNPWLCDEGYGQAFLIWCFKK